LLINRVSNNPGAAIELGGVEAWPPSALTAKTAPSLDDLLVLEQADGSTRKIRVDQLLQVLNAGSLLTRTAGSPDTIAELVAGAAGTQLTADPSVAARMRWVDPNEAGMLDLLASQSAREREPVDTEWIEILNPPGGQWKQGQYVTFPPTYGNPTLGDAVFRIGTSTGPVLNGFWPQAAGNNGPAQQHFLDEGVWVPRGYPLVRGEFSGLITTHATTQPLFHLQFHANSNVWALFAADPANLYNQLGAQGNVKFQVPCAISAKGFRCNWWITSDQDTATGNWMQQYHVELIINTLITHTITAGNGAGAVAISLPFRGYSNVMKTAGAAGTWDPHATDVNLALRFANYLNAADPGDGQNLLDVRSTRAWAGRRVA
jgi:hypothetical protein